jgi:hypothetical protein
MQTAVALLLALVVSSGGVYLLVRFIRHLRLRLAMAGWPRFNATVRGHRIYSYANRHGAGYHRGIVTVEYKDAGRTWRVDCGSPTRLGFASENAARSVFEHFPLGKNVEVYVDRDNPQRAFLYPPEISALLMLLLGALFLLTFGVGVLNGLNV